MANEHIGRKQSIGLGKESTSGTAVAATDWIPKISGSFTPIVDTANDDGAYGIIDSVKEVQSVKNMTEIQFSAVARDDYFGHILMALLGTTYACVKVPVTSVSGTFVEGETVTESTSSATATVRRVDVSGTSGNLYLEPASGTLTGGETLTGGTSSATATGGTIIAPGTGKNHLFRRLNTNTPVTYTIYGSDPVSDDRAAYCALDSLNFECVVGDFAKFDARFMGKKLGSTSAQTPTFTAQNPFLAKHATFKLAADHDSLTAANALSIERVSFDCPKNLVDFTAVGDTDPASFHNQDFGPITGEITLLYNATTQRDYVIDSTKRAARLTIANTAVTAISGSEYPTLQFDFPSLGFTQFSRPSENGGLVKQTVSFTAEYNVARSLTMEALLQNSQTSAY